MITKKEFEAAMVIVNDYCDQIAKKKYVAENANEVGCRVKLSAWGRKMQRPHNKEGIVVNWSQWMHFENDGTVTVKWDDVKKPVDMHVSQVEPVKNKSK